MSETDEIDVETEAEEDEISVQFDIATYPSDFTLVGIHKMWHDGDIEIPDFQREFVWTIKQSSLLIESFLVGLPVPPVFFYIDDEHKNLVIDGQQRILSAVYFFDGLFGEESVHGKKQVFRLTGLDERSPYHAQRFEDLVPADQRKLHNAVLRAINVRQLSPKGESTSIYHIFERLNTGGTALKPQEIRNCVFRGNFIALLKKLNDDKNWRAILGKKTKDRHQKDVELILRIFALTRGWSAYEKPMKEHLNVAMRQNQSGNSDVVRKFAEQFPVVCDYVVSKLGPNPFHIRGPLNTSVLDSVFSALLENFDHLPRDVIDRYKALLSDIDFINLTYSSTTDTKVLRDRFTKARKYLIG